MKVIDLIKYIIERMVEGTRAVMLHMLKYVPGVQGVDGEALDIGGYPLAYVPDRLKTQEMCERAVEDKPEALRFVPDHIMSDLLLNLIIPKRLQKPTGQY